MAEQLQIKCECGAVKGTLQDSPAGNRLVCMCSSCQAFARFLGQAKILDEHGGTDIYQVTPSQIAFSQGVQEIRCMRLSDSGIWRWYTDCCKTPIGNTMASTKIAFLGLPTVCLDEDLKSIPPISARIHGRCATSPCEGAHPTAPVKLFLKIVGRLIANGLQGRGSPSPFIVDGKPLVEPMVLSLAERESLGLETSS
ncbi:MAG: hypothetical protein GKR90_11615 [Pseudomonadales bacterium]|nr:hypothetical protein [Pseudomonadales bacterium]